MAFVTPQRTTRGSRLFLATFVSIRRGRAHDLPAPAPRGSCRSCATTRSRQGAGSRRRETCSRGGTTTRCREQWLPAGCCHNILRFGFHRRDERKRITFRVQTRAPDAIQYTARRAGDKCRLAVHTNSSSGHTVWVQFQKQSITRAVANACATSSVSKALKRLASKRLFICKERRLRVWHRSPANEFGVRAEAIAETKLYI